MNNERSYIAIDLKSFYASVECTWRDMDPLTTNLVVADSSRTEKTICLAVSPSLKAYGIPGRARLFEVMSRLREVNEKRVVSAPGKKFEGESWDAIELEKHPELKVATVVAPPQMARYISVSTEIYNIYLKYVAPEDIHVYSIDEVFMDVTDYLKTYNMTPRMLAEKMIKEVYDYTHITATAGIGTNLFLCKVAMDIVAKHMPPDENGARIAEINEQTYRELLWNHRPLTDFWRVGPGYAKKLQDNGMFTMGDIARCSLGKSDEYHNEDLLYKLFGINAELLIDHAWGFEPCTIEAIKNYKPMVNCVSSGHVLQQPYDFDKGKLVVKEMTDALVLDLVDHGLVTNQLVLNISYDIENLNQTLDGTDYKGEIVIDRYGRKIPKGVHGNANLKHHSSSTEEIIAAVTEVYDKIVDRNLYIRRVNITANHVIKESESKAENEYVQMNLFSDFLNADAENTGDEGMNENKEKNIQHALLEIRKRYGKNAVLRGMNLTEGATAIQRNSQIGGHKA